jgi:hypothetical protein
MTVVTLTCPYCNAPALVQPDTSPGRRITCARCGEFYIIRAVPQDVGADLSVDAPNTNSVIEALSLSDAPFSGAPLYKGPRPQKNGLLGGAILGVMLLMAGLGLSYALYTQRERRANDTAMKKRPDRSLFSSIRSEAQLEPISPWRLPALGYLPPGMNLVAGLHVAELARDNAGRQVLDQRFQIGRVAVQPGQIARWCGLPLEDIDHVVLGIASEDPILPRAVLIVRTNRPFQPESIRLALKGTSVPGSNKKHLYQFNLDNPAVQILVWCIDGRTLAMALIPSHLEEVPAEPRTGLDHLQDRLRTTLKERVESGALLWIAGAIDDRTRTLLETLAPQVKKENGNVIAAVQTFAAWVKVGQAVRVGAAFQGRDDAAARMIEEIFDKPAGAGNPQLKVARDDTWVTVQYNTDLESVLKALRK